MVHKPFSKEWFKMIYLSFLPHDRIKFFPPNFTVRDPYYTKMEEVIKQGAQIYVMIFDIKDFRLWANEKRFDQVEIIINDLKQLFKNVVPQYFANKEILFLRLNWGDDFVVTIQGNKENCKEIEEKGLKIKEHIEQEARDSLTYLNDHFCFHFGYAPIEEDTTRVFDAFNKALYQAHAMAKKKIGPHYYHIKEEIQRIINDEDISFVMDPIVSLRGSGIEGYELLTRGPSESIYFKPLDLFDLAKSAHLQLPLEIMVFRKAIEEVHTKGIRSQVFINITASSLESDLYFDHVTKTLKEYPSVDPQRVVIELTGRETIRDITKFRVKIDSYRDLGFRLAIDNAGAGYGPLMVISELLPDYIKVDQIVITHIDQKLVKESMLSAFLYIAEKIQAKVIAEGIERQEELELLLRNRVDFGQGYFFMNSKANPLQRIN